MATGVSNNNNNDVQKVPIVNALLTFTAALYRNSSHDRMIILLTSHFDLTEMKDAKTMLCNEVNKEFGKRKSSDLRSEKTAHAIDICEIIRDLDVTDMPLFVMDSISYANLPRVNAEDVSYVAVADKLADISAKIDLMNDSISMNAARSIANADRIETISTQTMCAHENSHHYARQARFTVPPSSRSAIAQSNCRIGGITDSSYANQLKIPAKTQQQRLLNVTKTGVNVGNVPIIGSAMSEIANVQQQHGPLPQAAVLQQNMTQNDQKVSTSSVSIDEQIVDKQHNNKSNSADIDHKETVDTEPPEVQQTINDNNNSKDDGGAQEDAHKNSGTQNTTDGARDMHLQSETVGVRINGTPETTDDVSLHSNRHTTYNGNDWKLPQKHARKMERFLNKNSLHGTAISTKVKGATAPPDELFISRVDGDTTEADMAEYILDLGVHIIDLELTSHYEARNKSFKLTVNKNDFYKLLDASLWPDGVKVGRYRKPRNNREYSNRQYS